MQRFLRIALPVLLAAAPVAALAQIRLLPNCTATGDCGVTDILAVFVNVAEYLLGISGAVALGFFVYGGFRYVLSRGKPEEVKGATAILTSAAWGIGIIFLSGVLVRFTIQALTGGSSAIPTIGESCVSKPAPGRSLTSAEIKAGATGDGLWVSIPQGVTEDGKIIPETLLCIAKDDCKSLNAALSARGRSETYTCIDVAGGSSCVRGLCPSKSADFACCLR